MLPFPPARTSAGFVPVSWSRAARRAGSLLLDLLYPPRCAGCGTLDTTWCRRCATAFASLSGPFALNAPPPIQAAWTTRTHDGIPRQMVHALKYESCRAIADVLAVPMAQAIESAGWTACTLIPVPLHHTRLRERGYNQAEWLADSVAALTGLECLPYGLVRTRSTAHQVGASAAERRANMEGAFVPAGDALNGRFVILVDDVFTTGATLCASAQAALAGGATSVVSLTATAARAGAQTAPP